jgi:hypothetical protein
MTANDDLHERTTTTAGCLSSSESSGQQEEEDKNEATRPTSTQNQIRHQLRRFIGDLHRCTKV